MFFLNTFNPNKPAETITHTAGHIQNLSERRQAQFYQTICDFFSEKAFFEKKVDGFTSEIFSKTIKNLWHALPENPQFTQFLATTFKTTGYFSGEKLGKNAVHIVDQNGLAGWIPKSYLETVPEVSPSLLLAIHRLHLKSMGQSNDLLEQDIKLLNDFAARYGSQQLKDELKRLTPSQNTVLEDQEEHQYSRWFDLDKPAASIDRFINRCTLLSAESQRDGFRDIQRFFSDAAFSHHPEDFKERFKKNNLSFLVNSGLFVNDKAKEQFIQNVQQVVGVCHTHLAEKDRYYPVIGYMETKEFCSAIHSQLPVSEVAKSNLEVVDGQVKIKQSDAANAFLLTPKEKDLNYENPEELVEMFVFALDSGVPMWIEKATKTLKETASIELDSALAKYLDREDVRNVVGRTINPDVNKLNKEQLCGLFSYNCKQLYSINERIKYSTTFRESCPATYSALINEIKKIEKAPAFWEALNLYRNRDGVPKLHKNIINDWALKKIADILFENEVPRKYAKQELGRQFGLQRCGNQHQGMHKLLYSELQKPHVVEYFNKIGYGQERIAVEKGIGAGFGIRKDLYFNKLWNEMGEEKLGALQLQARDYSHSTVEPKTVFNDIFRGSLFTWNLSPEEARPFYHFLCSEAVTLWASTNKCTDLIDAAKFRMEEKYESDKFEKIYAIREAFKAQGRRWWPGIQDGLFKLLNEKDLPSDLKEFYKITDNNLLGDDLKTFLEQEGSEKLFNEAGLGLIYKNLFTVLSKRGEIAQKVEEFFGAHINQKYIPKQKESIKQIIQKCLTALYFMGEPLKRDCEILLRRNVREGDLLPLMRMLKERNNDQIMEDWPASRFREELIGGLLSSWDWRENLAPLDSLLQEMRRLYPQHEKVIRYLNRVLPRVDSADYPSLTKREIRECREICEIAEQDDVAIKEIVIDPRLDQFYSTEKLRNARNNMKNEYPAPAFPGFLQGWL